jgi:diguanylate cyclase (GGDEF)-like protein
VISGSGAQDVVIRSLRSGSVDFIPKNEALDNDVLWQRVSLAVERRRLREQLRRRGVERRRHLLKLASTDPLTGLANRRELDRILGFGCPFDIISAAAVVMIDIDHFKSVNDQYGHPAGDEILRQMAQHITATLPAGGFAFRWGGEEFLVILTATHLPHAVGWANRLRRRLAFEGPRVANQSRMITASMGVATACGAANVAEAIGRADQAMYLAKRKGRDQVCTWPMAQFDALAARLTCRDPEGRLAELLDTGADMLGHTQREHLTCHSEHVCDVAAACGRILGSDLAELDHLRRAGRFHDIGKWAVPENLLRKPSALDADERALIDQHADLGADMGSRLGLHATECTYIRYHHLWFDEPRPRTLVENPALSRGAGILAVADAFSAMTSARPYQAAKSRSGAVDELLRFAGKQFDPAAVAAVRSLVSSGNTAVAR